MKTILKSIFLTTLVAIFCACVFTLLGLILNFWNETLANASLAFIASVVIGTISYFGIDVAIQSCTGDKLPF